MASERIGLEAALEMDAWSRGVDQYQRDVDQMEGANERASASSRGFADILKGSLAVAIGQELPKAIGRAVDWLGSFAREAAAEEVGVARLAASVKATGANWDEASVRIEAYLKAEARRAALDDGVGRETLARLVGMTGDYNKALALLPVAEDLAAAKGMDLATAGMIVGRVAEGNTEMLRRYGIILKENATATEALTELQNRFAGSAEALANTYEGASRRLQIAVGNVKEDVGSIFLPAMTAARQGMAEVVEAVEPFVAAFAQPISDALRGAVPLIGQAMNEVLLAFGINLEQMAATGGEGGYRAGVAVAEGLEAALPYLIGVIQAIGRIIAYWFKPSSPPRVAKDIGKWGRQLGEAYYGGVAAADFGQYAPEVRDAMIKGFQGIEQDVQAAQVDFAEGWADSVVTAYMDAFAEADFGPVVSFSSQLRSVLEQGVKYGLLSKDDMEALAGPLLGLFQDLFIESQTFGRVSEQSFARLRTAAGPLGAQVERVARAFLGEKAGVGFGAGAVTGGAADATTAVKEAIEKAAGGKGAADLADLLAGVTLPGGGIEFPEFVLDTEKIRAQAGEIADSIFEALKPTIDEIKADPNGIIAGIGAAVVDGIRQAISDALFAPKAKRVEFEPGRLAEKMMPADAGWSEIGLQIGANIFDGIIGAFSGGMVEKRQELADTIAKAILDTINAAPTILATALGIGLGLVTAPATAGAALAGPGIAAGGLSTWPGIGAGLIGSIIAGMTGAETVAKLASQGAKVLTDLRDGLLDVLGYGTEDALLVRVGETILDSIGLGVHDGLPTFLSNLEGYFADTDWGKLGVIVVDGIIDQIRLSASRLFGAIMDALLAGGASAGSGQSGGGGGGGSGGGGGGSGVDGGGTAGGGASTYTGGYSSGKVGGKVSQSPVYRTVSGRGAGTVVTAARSVNVNFGGVTINNGMDMDVLDARIRQTATQAARMMA